jgi:hypothetical protein
MQTVISMQPDMTKYALLKIAGKNKIRFKMSKIEMLQRVPPLINSSKNVIFVWSSSTQQASMIEKHE